MAWIAVDPNDDEYIFRDEPVRFEYYFDSQKENVIQDYIVVPRGTSLKLTGKQMTWNDEPIELE